MPVCKIQLIIMVDETIKIYIVNEIGSLDNGAMVQVLLTPNHTTVQYDRKVALDLRIIVASCGG